jgi:hypothetical protein
MEIVSMRNKDFVSKVVTILLFIPFFAGCNAPKSQLEVFNGYFRSSDYAKSLEFASSKISNSQRPGGEDLLWSLQAGSIERLQHNCQRSTEYFDKSEEMLKYFDLQSNIGDAAVATIVNDNAMPYKGEEYDGIMVNTYKALNFMISKNDELARVEFNRAMDRQRRAKEKYAREINKLKEEIEKEQQTKGSRLKDNIENPKIKQLISQRYAGLYEFEAYPDFVNPFSTYIAGIYFNLAGDHSKAVDLLKEAYGMVQNNSYIAEDLATTEKVLDGGAKLNGTVWVIFENGMGPVKEEFRIDLPLFIVTNKVKYVGIALPKLAFREQAYPYLSVKADANEYKTEMVANMDRVVQTEFNKDFNIILTRAIISATAKAIAQYAIQEQDSSAASFASILMAAYSFATTAADVRIWTALPKDFQTARFRMPNDRRITIIPPGGVVFDIQIPDCSNAIVYLKIPFKEAMPVYDVITY